MNDSSLVVRKGVWSTIVTSLGMAGDRTRGRSWPGRGSHLLAVLWLGVLSLIFLGSLSRFPYYSPFASVEEMALMYTSAGNFLRYGFSNSGFLQDFSTSSDSADHPYVYNHMPPGPEITVALLLKASGGSYRAVRVVFWILFLVGTLCYLRLAGLVLDNVGLSGAGYTVLFFSPFISLRAMDDPLYALFPLFAFLPLMLLASYYRTNCRGYLYSMLGAGFLSSIYLDYLSSAVVVYCWIFLYLTRLLRVDGRHLLIFLGVMGCGVVAHLFQNFLYLGPSVFAQELIMTATNRTVGVPPKATLREFYERLGVVHHGSTPIILNALLSNIRSAFELPGNSPALLAGIACVALVLSARWGRGASNGDAVLPRGEPTPAIGFFWRLAVWVSGTLILSMLTFPAFTQEYGMHAVGLSAYFTAIAATAVLLYAIQTAVNHRPRDLPRTAALASRVALVLVMIYLAGSGGWAAVQASIDEFRGAMSEYRQFKYAAMEDIRTSFGGELYMTNINPVAVGFFVREAGYGVCELASLPVEGDVDPTKCHVAYMKRRDHYRNIRPRYFFFFSQDLFPGFAECLPTMIMPSLGRGGDACVELMRRRLSDRFAKTYENVLFTVFDLHRPK